MIAAEGRMVRGSGLDRTHGMHVCENIETESGIWKYETTRDVKLCSSAPAHVDCFAHQATVIASRLAQ